MNDFFNLLGYSNPSLLYAHLEDGGQASLIMKKGNHPEMTPFSLAKK